MPLPQKMLLSFTAKTREERYEKDGLYSASGSASDGHCRADADAGGNVSLDTDSLDPMFEEAARLIVVHQQGSTSLIQRKFSIGYNRAGRLMDQLERAGIVGPIRGSKPREVLIADEIELDSKIAALKGM